MDEERLFKTLGRIEGKIEGPCKHDTTQDVSIKRLEDEVDKRPTWPVMKWIIGLLAAGLVAGAGYTASVDLEHDKHARDYIIHHVIE